MNARGLVRNPVRALAGDRICFTSRGEPTAAPSAPPAGRADGRDAPSGLRASPEVGRLVPRGVPEVKFEPVHGARLDQDSRTFAGVREEAVPEGNTPASGTADISLDGWVSALGGRTALQAAAGCYPIPLSDETVLTLKLVLAHDGVCFARFCADAIAAAATARANEIGLQKLARQGRL